MFELCVCASQQVRRAFKVCIACTVSGYEEKKLIVPANRTVFLVAVNFNKSQTTFSSSKCIKLQYQQLIEVLLEWVLYIKSLNMLPAFKCIKSERYSLMKVSKLAFFFWNYGRRYWEIRKCIYNKVDFVQIKIWIFDKSALPETLFSLVYVCDMIEACWRDTFEEIHLRSKGSSLYRLR